jgi:putative nucleotidyltransferase with HDIG domain
MVTPTIQELISQNIDLVSLPAIVHRINALINDPNASANDIATLISQDPALTARLLKIVNSPLYRPQQPIESVMTAVSLLGTRQLRDLVIAQALIHRFSKNGDGAFAIEIFWCHSITTGIAAKMIAKELRLPNIERLFIAGLLHDIGKIVMLQLMPRESLLLQRAANHAKSDLDTIEQRYFGFTHAELGGNLLRSWNFPDSLIEACENHHTPEKAQTHSIEAAITHVADIIANNIQTPVSPDDDTVMSDFALRLLGVNQPLLEKFHEDAYQSLDDILQALYYDLAA